MTLLRCLGLLVCLVLLVAWPMRSGIGAPSEEGPVETAGSQGPSGEEVEENRWETHRDGLDDVHRVRFTVSDGDCAYRLMVTPDLLVAHFRYVVAAEMHASSPTSQDVTFSERFFLVARGRSRYRRTLVPNERVEWHLVEGRQAVHDGIWQIDAVPGNAPRSVIVFENRIRAKKRLHQRVLRGIQRRTMSDIVEATQAFCGAG